MHKKISIRVWFPAVIVITMVVMVAVVLTVASSYVNDMLYRQSRADMERQSNAVVNAVGRETYRMIDTINNIYYKVIKDNRSSLSVKKQDFVALCNQKHSGIVSISLYDSEGNLLLSSSDYYENPAINKAVFQDVRDNVGKIFFGNPQISFNNGAMNSVIPASCMVDIINNGYIQMGFLRVEFTAKDIYSIIDAYGNTERSYCYLINDKNEIVYHPYQKKLESGIGTEWSLDYIASDTHYIMQDIDDISWLIGTNNIGYSGWRVVMVNSFNDVHRQELLSYQVVWWIISIMALLIAIIDIVLFHELSSPISNLDEAMKKFSAGDMNVRVPAKGVGELRHLENGFNRMVEHIEILMAEILGKEKEKGHMERRLLQAQISPHFLYNTLDSIIWMIQGKQYEGAEKMVYLLAKFFRIALSKGQDMIPLEQELQHAVSYLSIQGIRFHDKFEVFIDVDDSLNKYLCPKVTLQPILENAIYHGMDGMYGDGEISVRVYQSGENICLEIADNGAGMTEEQVTALMNNKTNEIKIKPTSKGSGIGVANVNERIKLIFGEEYGITVESEPDEGTTVKIVIPRVEKNE